MHDPGNQQQLFPHRHTNVNTKACGKKTKKPQAILLDYASQDHATGVMIEDTANGGRFVSVTLNPVVTVTESSMTDKANALHEEANKKCFISNSVNFPVNHKPQCLLHSN